MSLHFFARYFHHLLVSFFRTRINGRDVRLSGRVFRALMIFALSAIWIAVPVRADISTVGFVHTTILDVKGIDLPIGAEIDATSPNSVRYMLTQIDAANAVNGNTTNYATGANAVSNVMDTARVVADVTELVLDAPGEFRVTLTGMAANDVFKFSMSAAGDFSIDWGDGTAVETIMRADTTNTTYTHTYTSTGDYVVTIRGRATSYSTSETTAAISFYPFNKTSANRTKMTAISGDLGKLFPILNTSASGGPRFYETFYSSQGLTEIPSDLFASVRGAPVSYMFRETFSDCTGLTGSIPGTLFSGMSGAPASYMFYNTFYKCIGLTSIPGTLFAGIRGAPASVMFNGTFKGCTGLTGEIPSGLFGGLSGAPAYGMFDSTFSGCTGLTGEIPSGLFGTFVGAPAMSMFNATFYGCAGLTGEIPTTLFSGISGAPAGFMFGNTFFGCSGLTGEIPSGLFGVLSGAPAAGMFASTFSGCTGLTGEIPSGLFGTFVGAPAMLMFSGTFEDCTGLTGEIPSGLFGTFVGAPVQAMFSDTFHGCSGLTSIADGIWDLSGVNNSSVAGMFDQTFYGCTGITSASPNIAPGNAHRLYQKFTVYTGQRAFYNCTRMSDYASISAAWK